MKKSIEELLSTIDEKDWFKKIRESQDPKTLLAENESVTQSKIIANIRQQQPFRGDKSDIQPIQTYTYKSNPSKLSVRKKSEHMTI